MAELLPCGYPEGYLSLSMLREALGSADELKTTIQYFIRLGLVDGSHGSVSGFDKEIRYIKAALTHLERIVEGRSGIVNKLRWEELEKDV